VPYLVFAVIVALTLAGWLVGRRRGGKDPSKSVASFHRRLDALDQQRRVGGRP
jgi:hypothetical protein